MKDERRAELMRNCVTLEDCDALRRAASAGGYLDAQLISAIRSRQDEILRLSGDNRLNSLLMR